MKLHRKCVFFNSNEKRERGTQQNPKKLYLAFPIQNDQTKLIFWYQEPHFSCERMFFQSAESLSGLYRNELQIFSRNPLGMKFDIVGTILLMIYAFTHVVFGLVFLVGVLVGSHVCVFDMESDTWALPRPSIDLSWL